MRRAAQVVPRSAARRAAPVRQEHPGPPCLAGWTHLDLERPADVGVLRRPRGVLRGPPAARWSSTRPSACPSSSPCAAASTGPRPGRFVLLGSASPTLMRSVSETLAGRVGILELTPFRLRTAGRPQAPDRWFWGGYPPVLASREPGPHRVARRLRFDLSGARPARPRRGACPPGGCAALDHADACPRQPPQRLRPGAFPGGLVAHGRRDLDVLEGGFMIRRLPPFLANVQKRLTKSPKLYVRDTGLLHHPGGTAPPTRAGNMAQAGQLLRGPRHRGDDRARAATGWRDRSSSSGGPRPGRRSTCWSSRGAEDPAHRDQARRRRGPAGAGCASA